MLEVMIKFWAGMLTGILVMLMVGVGVFWFVIREDEQVSSGENKWDMGEVAEEKILNKFSFPELAKTQFTATPIEVGEIQEKGEGWTSYIISYTWEGRKITGQLTRPDAEKYPGKRPVI